MESKITDLSNQIESLKKTIIQLQGTILKQNYTISAQEISKNLLYLGIRDLKEKVVNTAELFKKYNDEMNKKMPDFRMIWLKYHIMESLGYKFNLTKVFSTKNNDACTTRAFRDKCSGIAPGLFIAEEKETNNTFGGFTTQKFDNTARWKKDEKAFTFSFLNMQKCNIKPDQTDYAIYAYENYYYTDYNLVGFGGYDIWIEDNCLNAASEISVNQTYNCPGSQNPFFYTLKTNPTLQSFEYYQVKIENPK